MATCTDLNSPCPFHDAGLHQEPQYVDRFWCRMMVGVSIWHQLLRMSRKRKLNWTKWSSSFIKLLSEVFRRSSGSALVTIPRPWSETGFNWQITDAITGDLKLTKARLEHQTYRNRKSILFKSRRKISRKTEETDLRWNRRQRGHTDIFASDWLNISDNHFAKGPRIFFRNSKISVA